MPNALCPQCHSPLPPTTTGESMVVCGGCGKKVFHANAGGDQTNSEDDWLSLGNEPTSETVKQSPRQNRDSGSSETLDPFLQSDERLDANARPDNAIDDGFDDLVMAPEKTRPSNRGVDVGVENLFGDLDLPELPDRPPPPQSPPQQPRTPQRNASQNSPQNAPIQPDTLAVPAKAAASDLLSANDDAEFRIKCQICDSVMFVRPDKVGSVIECSDCHTKMRVPPPPKKVAAKPKLNTAAKSLGPQAAASAGDAMMLRGGAKAPRPADPYAKSASELLDQASREDLDQPDDDYEVPDVIEWAKGVVSIFKDIGVIAHWLILGTFGSIAAGIAAMVAHPLMAIFMFPGAGTFGLLVLACGFAILESTANQTEDIENWPTLDFGLLFDNVIVTGAAVLVAGVPAFAATFMVFGNSLVTVAVSMMSIYAFFPFVLLSILDSGSVFQPFSSEVARSVNKCHESWGGLYFTAGVLFAGWFLLLLSFGAGGSTVGVSVVVFSFIALVFLYFAMIGRLAFAIGQSVRSENARLSDEQDDD